MKLSTYQFRYANASGGIVRSTMMQCETDAQAIHAAQTAMQDAYATLEILEGDRVVFSVTQPNDAKVSRHPALMHPIGSERV